MGCQTVHPKFNYHQFASDDMSSTLRYWNNCTWDLWALSGMRRCIKFWDCVGSIQQTTWTREKAHFFILLNLSKFHLKTCFVFFLSCQLVFAAMTFLQHCFFLFFSALHQAVSLPRSQIPAALPPVVHSNLPSPLGYPSASPYHSEYSK